ncbi:MAG TPA: GIY-YIG nuclease family protein [Thermoanaerobaculia bacterium]|nr:GIY-YIG nuclease family protein [Thermoanaerobaculia bacterium]
MIEKGVRHHGKGLEAYVRVNRNLIRKSFPLNTSIHTIREWRRLQKVNPPKWAAKLISEPLIPSLLPASPTGWCYLYVIQSGAFVKIGRARDIASRLQNLQIGSPEPLRLLAVAPTHWTLEDVAHRAFAEAREQGEWFRLTPEIAGFIKHLRSGANPLTFFWPDAVTHASIELAT